MTDFENWYISFIDFPTVIDYIGFIALLCLSVSMLFYIFSDWYLRQDFYEYKFKKIALSFFACTLAFTALFTSILINVRGQFIMKQVTIHLQETQDRLDRTHEILQRMKNMDTTIQQMNGDK